MIITILSYVLTFIFFTFILLLISKIKGLYLKFAGKNFNKKNLNLGKHEIFGNVLVTLLSGFAGFLYILPFVLNNDFTKIFYFTNAILGILLIIATILVPAKKSTK